LRPSLSDESTHVATVLGSWASVDSLVPSYELMDMIWKKQYYWGGGNNVSNSENDVKMVPEDSSDDVMTEN
jgi:hypothetical protein